MANTLASTIVIAPVDVLYVTEQIQKDLNRLRSLYPDLITYERKDAISLSIGPLIRNDAITKIGFSIYDPKQENLAYHQLTYIIDYVDDPRTMEPGGIGGAPIQAVPIPSSAVFVSWVRWSPTMLALPLAEQGRIVEGTVWGTPGSQPFDVRYPTHWKETDMGKYSSGHLSVSYQSGVASTAPAPDSDVTKP